MPYTTLPSISANKVLTASYLNNLNEDLRVISGHNHSGSAGEGASLLLSTSAASPFTSRQEIISHIVPSATNFSIVRPATNIFAAYQQSSATTPASIAFPIGLLGGTYQITLMHEKNTNLGIASLVLAQSVGISPSTASEIDFYGTSLSSNQITKITASIPNSGSYIVMLSACGKKNVSSSNSAIRFTAIHLYRTGN